MDSKLDFFKLILGSKVKFEYRFGVDVYLSGPYFQNFRIWRDNKASINLSTAEIFLNFFSITSATLVWTLNLNENYPEHILIITSNALKIF